MIRKIGITLILLSSILLLITKLNKESIVNREISKISAFFTKDKKVSEKIEANNNLYSMIIEIPQINLKKGLYSITSPLNTVDKNLEILSYSNMPDEDNGNVIIAGHSGTSDVSYFRYLYKLNINDLCYIYYKGNKYTYEIKKIYNEEKNGTITIHKDNNISTITLITCTFNNDKMQTVYIGNLINIENY